MVLSCLMVLSRRVSYVLKKDDGYPTAHADMPTTRHDFRVPRSGTTRRLTTKVPGEAPSIRTTNPSTLLRLLLLAQISAGKTSIGGCIDSQRGSTVILTQMLASSTAISMQVTAQDFQPARFLAVQRSSSEHVRVYGLKIETGRRLKLCFCQMNIIVPKSILDTTASVIFCPEYYLYKTLSPKGARASELGHVCKAGQYPYAFNRSPPVAC